MGLHIRLSAVPELGHVKGGLAISTAGACTMFGAVSGSTQATVVAVGGPLRPRLLRLSPRLLPLSRPRRARA